MLHSAHKSTAKSDERHWILVRLPTSESYKQDRTAHVHLRTA